MAEIDTPNTPNVTPVRKPKTKYKEKPREEFSRQQNYCCAICRHILTSSAAALVKDGNHFHDRVNPDGRRFLIACFREAPGCQISGHPVMANSWFDGYYWSFALCANCSCQVGWHYTGDEEFYGLMIEQIVDCQTGSAG